jgi:NADPH:quinone reductase-like Zn-dependent oxidoreductase
VQSYTAKNHTSTESSTMAIPGTQKAIMQPDKMSTSVTMITDHPTPTPDFDADEHLVRVHTAAITNGELLWSKNFPLPAWSTKVLVPCNDVAGTVIAAPPSSPFQPGTEVYARSSYARTGCAREYTILLGEEMAERPQCLSWAKSAAVPMSAETAWQALFVHAGLEARKGSADGKRVFVIAASGGAGVWMVQLAKWAGAEVIGTCSTANVDMVRSLGADVVLDYTKIDVKQWTADQNNHAELVIDCFGGKALEDAWWVVKEGGTLLSIFQPPEEKKPVGAPTNVRNSFFVMTTSGEQLRKMSPLIDEGMRPALDSVIPFDEYQRAFNKLASGRTKGKIVLDLMAH